MLIETTEVVWKNKYSGLQGDNGMRVYNVVSDTENTSQDELIGTHIVSVTIAKVTITKFDSLCIFLAGQLFFLTVGYSDDLLTTVQVLSQLPVCVHFKVTGYYFYLICQQGLLHLLQLFYINLCV